MSPEHRTATKFSFVAAGVLVVGWVGYFSWTAPSPGDLTDAHSELTTSSDIGQCSVCHGGDGLVEACLDCHVEIAEQHRTGNGFHASILADGKENCAGCHGEHYGHAFDMVGPSTWKRAAPGGFEHQGVDYHLVDAHDALNCEECHRPELVVKSAAAARIARTAGTLVSPTDAPLAAAVAPSARGPAMHFASLEGTRERSRRKDSYLGLSQDCTTCHVDVHGAGMKDDCAECHDQMQFLPASGFDHATAYVLDGKHFSTSCEKCHTTVQAIEHGAVPFGALPFDQVPGNACLDCHEYRHLAANDAMYDTDCARCHSAADYKSIHFDRDDHGRFALVGAHRVQTCSTCHQNATCTMAGAENQNCHTCHGNAHVADGRSFQLWESAAVGCDRCHLDGTWKAPGLAADLHQRAGFPLIGGHQSADCRVCHHRVNSRPDVPATDCKLCHEDPHREKLAGECADCHRQEHLHLSDGLMSAAQHQFAAFALDKPHAKVDCNECHKGTAFVARFPGRVKEQCAVCHPDPHQGQFAERYPDCTSCHPDEHWNPASYGPPQHDQYLLEGNHLAVACIECHKVPAADAARRFVGTPKDCASCHVNPHGDQFASKMVGNGTAGTGTVRTKIVAAEVAKSGCAQCHVGFDGWQIKGFDHDQTAFKLLGVHQKTACNDCHVINPGSTVRAYVATPSTCTGCHTDPHRSQLTGPTIGDCNRCHTNDGWKPDSFDHQKHSRYALDGSHRDVECRKCHPSQALADGSVFVRYRPLPSQCRDCHEVR